MKLHPLLPLSTLAIATYAQEVELKVPTAPPNEYDIQYASEELPSAPVTTVTPVSTFQSQCDSWIQTALSSDMDSSSGLSEDEFFFFLTSITTPEYAADYFSTCCSDYSTLPWIFRVVHKSLACRCQSLGYPEGCCEGDGAEVLLDGFDKTELERSEEEKEYRNVVCQQISYGIEVGVPTPVPTGSPVAASTTSTTTTSTTTTTTSTTTTTTSTTTEEATTTTTEAPETTTAATTTSATTTTTEAATTEAPVEAIAPSAPVAITFEVVGSVVDYSEGAAGNSEIYLTAEDIASGVTNTVLDDVTAAFETLVGEVYLANQVLVNQEANDANEADEANAGVDEEVTGEETEETEEAAETEETEEAELEGATPAQDAGSDTRGIHGSSRFRKLLRGVSGVTGARGRKGRKLSLEDYGTLDPVTVVDSSCPPGLVYAPPRAPCLLFTFTLNPSADGLLATSAEGGEGEEEDNEGEEDDAIMTFASTMDAAINAVGRLYSIVVDANPTTDIRGLGSPGAGVEYVAPAEEEEGEEGELLSPETLPEPLPEPIQVERADPSDANTMAAEDNNGISTGGIVGIIFLILAVLVAVFALITYRRKQAEQARLQEFAGTPVSERDLEVGVSERAVAPPPVEKPVEKPLDPVEEVKEVKEEKEVPEQKPEVPEETPEPEPEPATPEPEPEAPKEDDDDDSSAASSVYSDGQETGADTLEEDEEQKQTRSSTLAAMGVASTVASRMYAADATGSPTNAAMIPDDASAATDAEAADAAAAGAPGAPRVTSTSIASGGFSQPSTNTIGSSGRSMESIRTEVESLVERTTPGKSVDELMAQYQGREEDLIEYLRRLLDQGTEIQTTIKGGVMS